MLILQMLKKLETMREQKIGYDQIDGVNVTIRKCYHLKRFFFLQASQESLLWETEYLKLMKTLETNLSASGDSKLYYSAGRR